MFGSDIGADQKTEGRDGRDEGHYRSDVMEKKLKVKFMDVVLEDIQL